MSLQTIRKFEKRAKYVATKFGYSQLADDFAQEVLLTFVEQPDRRSTIDQLFIDYLRDAYGRPGKPGYEQKHALETATSLDAPIVGRGDEKYRTLYDILPAREESQGDSFKYWDLYFMFTGTEKIIFEQFFFEDVTLKAIAEKLGVTESRICQILTVMCCEMRDYLKRQEEKEQKK